MVKRIEQWIRKIVQEEITLWHENKQKEKMSQYVGLVGRSSDDNVSGIGIEVARTIPSEPQRTYICPLCGKRCMTESGMVMHLQNDHGMSREDIDLMMQTL